MPCANLQPQDRTNGQRCGETAGQSDEAFRGEEQGTAHHVPRGLISPAE
jgi:hypothetical protein